MEIIYNFNLNEDIIEPKEIIFNDMNIHNRMIRCQINYHSTFIICFYFSNNNSQNYFTRSIFIIKEMNLILENTSIIMNSNEVKQIKLAVSYNDTYFSLN